MSSEHDVTVGIRQVEGYLLWNSKVVSARAEADEFTRQLDWLTTAQREDIEHVFVTQRLAMHKAGLLHIVNRTVELRAEYEARYARLKRRCLGLCAGGFGAAVGVCTYIVQR
ncbi:hypothetical protein [Streptomyces sp. NPDC059639]|uniref:hypothetical protein n=1 Tax=Streptomyces sp. NPDC059639 TaxID=3346891 RepID=UPI003674D1FB